MFTHRRLCLPVAALALALGSCSSKASLPLAPNVSAVSMSSKQADVHSEISTRQVSASYAVLSRFPGPSKGVQPLSTLVSVSASFFGTTYFGGGVCRYGVTGGCGTVFSFDSTSGKVSAVYSFSNGVTTGRNPRASLVFFKGHLYGTTYFGGNSGGVCRPKTSGCGVVFSIDPASGVQNVIYAFRGGANDGANPAAGLVVVNNKLYGVTANGGNSCGQSEPSCGTIFSITPAGKEVVEYRFKGSDGAAPIASLIFVNGKIYGTTSAGGSGTKCPSDAPGCGTVFGFDPSSRTLQTLYAFNGGKDGQSPRAPLLLIGGRLYGTTALGGLAGSGVVFSVARPGGNRRILHAFQGGQDGAEPVSGLIAVKGNLYGTTSQGGGKNNHGTVFAVNIRSSQEQVLHRFQAGQDGSSPAAALLLAKGKLYGTTAASTGSNYGTIFSITP
jgi:uncharacterized repeat protein (TIGR03803 family)